MGVVGVVAVVGVVGAGAVVGVVGVLRGTREASSRRATREASMAGRALGTMRREREGESGGQQLHWRCILCNFVVSSGPLALLLYSLNQPPQDNNKISICSLNKPTHTQLLQQHEKL